jgi:hypothetical protein
VWTHALDDLGLLDKERANDAVADAVGAARATVRTLDGLLPLRDLGVLAGAESRDLFRAGAWVSGSRAREAERRGRTPGRAMWQSPHLGAAAAFLTVR